MSKKSEGFLLKKIKANSSKVLPYVFPLILLFIFSEDIIIEKYFPPILIGALNVLAHSSHKETCFVLFRKEAKVVCATNSLYQKGVTVRGYEIYKCVYSTCIVTHFVQGFLS